MADVANAQQRSVGLRAHHDILELAGIGEAARRGHRILEIGAARRQAPGRSRPPDSAGSAPGSALLTSVAVTPSFGHLVGVQPHAHRVDLLRAQARFADARQAADLVHQVDLRVVGQEQRIVAVVAGHQADRHQERGGDFLHRHALPLHFGWQPRQRDVHAVLRLDRRDIGIGAELEGDVDGELAVVGAGGLVVQHAVQPDQLLFDRLRDGLFQILRVAAEIVRGDLHLTAAPPAGRPRSAGSGIATAPRMTITMAITIANTGRSMKNRAMRYSAFACAGGGGFS